MNILGIDTTTKSASCTILNADKYYTKEVTNEITHSEKLLPIIHDALTETNLSLDDINMFATINGPGSFTGIRIGLATIKAFAQVTGINIFSISSLNLISYVAATKVLNTLDKKSISVFSLIDAKNDRVYYTLNNVALTENGKYEITSIVKVQNDMIDDAVKNISSIGTDTLIIAGDCIDKHIDKLKELTNFEHYNLYPTTQDLIECYLSLNDTNDYMYNAYTLDAFYARESQAEKVNKK